MTKDDRLVSGRAANRPIKPVCGSGCCQSAQGIIEAMR